MDAKWCPGWDLNPHSPCGKKDFKSFASADFATRALIDSTRLAGFFALPCYLRYAHFKSMAEGELHITAEHPEGRSVD